MNSRSDDFKAQRRVFASALKQLGQNRTSSLATIKELLEKGFSLGEFQSATGSTIVKSSWFIQVIKVNDKELFDLCFQYAKNETSNASFEDEWQDESPLTLEDEEHLSPLHWAVLANNEHAFEALLEAGVTISRLSYKSPFSQFSPVELSCGIGASLVHSLPAHLPNMKMVELWLKNGYSMDCYVKDMPTLLHYALRRKEANLVLTIFQHASDQQLLAALRTPYYVGPFSRPSHELMRIKFNQEQWDLIFSRLKELKIDFDETEPKYKYSLTPLLAAARSANFLAIQNLFFSADISLPAKNSRGWNVVHCAIPLQKDGLSNLTEDNQDTPELEDILATLELILGVPEVKQIANEPDFSGQTPMKRAMQYGNVQIIETLQRLTGIQPAATVQVKREAPSPFSQLIPKNDPVDEKARLNVIEPLSKLKIVGLVLAGALSLLTLSLGILFLLQTGGILAFPFLMQTTKTLILVTGILCTLIGGMGASACIYNIAGVSQPAKTLSETAFKKELNQNNGFSPAKTRG